MKLGIFFEGDGEPDVLVSGIGVGTRKFNLENSSFRWKVKRDAFLILIAVLFGLSVVTILIIGPLISRATTPFDRKNDKKYAKQLFKVLRQETLYSNLDDSSLREYIAKILYERQMHWWNEKSFIAKWTLGLREPQPTDYLAISYRDRDGHR